MTEVSTEAKKRGRPARDRSAAGISVDEAMHDGIVMGDTRDPNTEVMQERIRVSLNSGKRQTENGYVLDWDNYHYCRFHESPTRPGRIAVAQEAFYEHCTDPAGNIIKNPSGAGFDYLMRLPKKYWAEDMKAAKDKRMALRSRVAQLKPGEYTVDEKGRPREDGEVHVSRKSSVNPYS
jgi:hypothetical protein